MRGKYSPTVTAAYMRDQEWHDKYRRSTEPVYDPEGFDSYGYNEAGYDRAGRQEYEYYHDDIEGEDGWGGENLAYERASVEWGFDGVKPVRR